MHGCEPSRSAAPAILTVVRDDNSGEVDVNT